jgi:hypothetical protein
MAQVIFKARAEATECRWTLKFESEDKTKFLTFHLIVAAAEEPKDLGQIFEAHNFEMNTVHDINMKAGSYITFIQKSVNGEWPFPMEFKENEVPAMFAGMTCLDIGDHFANEHVGQLSLKAQPVTAECKWALTFKNEATNTFLTFNISVHPVDTPTGELFEASKFEMNSVHDVHVLANSVITFM